MAPADRRMSVSSLAIGHARIVMHAVRVSLPRLTAAWAVASFLAILLAIGCGSSGTTNVVGPSNTKCSVGISNNTTEVPAGGATRTLTVTAERECAWSARAQVPWITLSPTAGQGSATVSYTVAPNGIATARRGTMAIAEQNVEVVQAGAPCRYDVTPATVSIESPGAAVTVNLNALAGCSWSARTNVPWISASPGAGTGSAAVRFTVAANAGDPRTGTVTLADASVVVRQASPAAPAPPPPTPAPAPTPPAPTPPPPSPTPAPPVPSPAPPTPPAPAPPTPPAPAPPPPPPPPAPATCSYALTPETRSVGAESDEFAVTVTTQSDCEWTASSEAEWISLVGRTGSGSGSFRARIDANTGGSRTGVVRVNDKTVTVQQAALSCSYEIKPRSYDSGRGPDDIQIAITAPNGCAWTSTSPAPWATVVDGRSGSGSGTTRVKIDPNSGQERNAELSIAGQPFHLRQRGACETSIKPTNYHAGRGPDDIKIEVKAKDGCSWTAASTVSWVTVAEGQTGTGDGDVRLLVEPNSDRDERRVTLIIAGQPFELRQDGSR